MTNYLLYNLDLGENPSPVGFQVGPYHIKPVEGYEKRVKLLPRSSHTITTIKNHKVMQKSIPLKIGKWSPTAIASVDKNEEPAILVEICETRSIWDLCILLTFFTGRRVCLADQRKDYLHHLTENQICSPQQLPNTAATAWENRAAVGNDKHLLPALYAYLDYSRIPDTISKAILINTAFECIFNKYGLISEEDKIPKAQMEFITDEIFNILE